MCHVRNGLGIDGEGANTGALALNEAKHVRGARARRRGDWCLLAVPSLDSYLNLLKNNTVKAKIAVACELNVQ